MPIYDWKCTECEKEETIITQKMDEYDKEPDETSSEDCEGHKWEKQLGTFRVTRGNWTGKKGNW